MTHTDHHDPAELPEFAYRGARTLILLHEQHLRGFLVTWQIAKGAGVSLPVTRDPDYASFEKLMVHVLSCAQRYLIWICQNLQLPDPQIDPPPDAAEVRSAAADYLEHLLARWRQPLTRVNEKSFFKPVFRSWWDVDYCVEAMLEHAAMHPLRHQLQLRELIAGLDQE
jgi:hypothetical protein